VKTLKDITRQLVSGSSGDADKLVEWVSTKI
jgi:hypothetical protein